MDKEEMVKIHRRLTDMNNDPNPLTYPDQPERSKREDFWPSDHIWCGCPNCGECKCKRCGALNTVET